MHKLIILLFFALSLGESLSAQDSLKAKPQKAILYENEQTVVIGDDTVNEESIWETHVKFEPYISFNDFKVDSIYSGAKAPLDLESNSRAWMLRSRITDDYNKSVNFGGHYILVQWRCGRPCQICMIIDTRTGKIYEGLRAYSGYEYRADSRMIIVNPPAANDNENNPIAYKKDFYNASCAYCHPQIFVWSEEQKQFIERKAGYK